MSRPLFSYAKLSAAALIYVLVLFISEVCHHTIIIILTIIIAFAIIDTMKPTLKLAQSTLHNRTYDTQYPVQ